MLTIASPTDGRGEGPDRYALFGRIASTGAPSAATAGLEHTGIVRITIWVQPGSSHAKVGGTHNGALVVRVHQRAVEGRATAAALTAVAAAFGVRPDAVELDRPGR